MASYDKKLLRESADHPLTAKRIGEILGCYGPDAVTRLRARRSVRVTVVGETMGDNGYSKKLYRVESVQSMRGPYCCGYCEQQRVDSLITI